jgi:hypothetical protein
VKDRIRREWTKSTAPGAVDRPAFRILVVLALGVTLATTWRLWQVRDGALPNLPALDVPQVGMGPVLVLALLGVLVRARWGIAGFTLVLATSMVMDQTRLQPTIVSLTFLLWATLPSKSALALCRAHLISLWFFAGAHKLLSAEFIASWGHGFQERWLWHAPGFSLPAFVVGVTELSLGVAMLLPRARRIGAWIVLAVHGGIALLLVSRGVNSAVWAWNGILALSGFVYFSRWRALADAYLAKLDWPARLAAVLIWLAPAGYYLNFVDAYLAHCLYSKNTLRATYHGEPVVDLSMREVNVPLPPELRLYELLFEQTASPGDVMRIEDRRAVNPRHTRTLRRD